MRGKGKVNVTIRDTGALLVKADDGREWLVTENEQYLYRVHLEGETRVMIQESWASWPFDESPIEMRRRAEMTDIAREIDEQLEALRELDAVYDAASGRVGY